jgi:hypothetical protein
MEQKKKPGRKKLRKILACLEPMLKEVIQGFDAII